MHTRKKITQYYSRKKLFTSLIKAHNHTGAETQSLSHGWAVTGKVTFLVALVASSASRGVFFALCIALAGKVAVALAIVAFAATKLSVSSVVLRIRFSAAAGYVSWFVASVANTVTSSVVVSVITASLFSFFSGLGALTGKVSIVTTVVAGHYSIFLSSAAFFR